MSAMTSEMRALRVGRNVTPFNVDGAPGDGRALTLVEEGESETRILVVSEDPLYGEGVKMQLEEAGHRPAFRVDSIGRAHRFCASDTEDRRHIVLWFVDTLDNETFGAGSELRQASWTGLCVVAESVDVELVTELVRERAGLFGVLLRTQKPSLAQIARMLEQLAEGTATVDCRILTRLVSHSQQHALVNLNPMDLRVLELVAAGLRNREIARRTRRSEKAVEKQMGRLFAKLGLDAGNSGHLDRRVAAATLFYSTRRIPTLAEAS